MFVFFYFLINVIIFFNIVEDRDFDPTPAHIIITDEIDPEKLYVVYIQLPPNCPLIRKRLTWKVIKQGIDSGTYYLYSLDYALSDDGLRDGIVSEIKKYLDDKNIQLPRA